MLASCAGVIGWVLGRVEARPFHLLSFAAIVSKRYLARVPPQVPSHAPPSCKVARTSLGKRVLQIDVGGKL